MLTFYFATVLKELRVRPEGPESVMSVHEYTRRQRRFTAGEQDVLNDLVNNDVDFLTTQTRTYGQIHHLDESTARQLTDALTSG